MGEAQSLLAMHPDQLAIDADRRRAGGQAEHGVAARPRPLLGSARRSAARPVARSHRGPPRRRYGFARGWRASRSQSMSWPYEELGRGAGAVVENRGVRFGEGSRSCRSSSICFQYRRSFVEPRLSFVTLGVADLARATRFYAEGLRLPRLHAPPTLSLFDLGPTWLALYPRSCWRQTPGYRPAATGSLASPWRTTSDRPPKRTSCWLRLSPPEAGS